RDDDNDDAGDRNLAGITVNLLDNLGDVVAVQTTDANGDYLFEDVTPGDYTIVQENATNFVDVTDVQGANDSQIAVSVGVGETVTTQNFVDEIPASIAGNVSRDDDNDGAGDRNLAGITVNLLDSNGDIVTTTQTLADGSYLFEDVTPGNYTIEQINDTDFVDVADVQGANDSQIGVSVAIGETVTAQDFVDEVPASIAGNVSQDENNDDAGERNLAGITVNLIDGAGVTVATQITGADGNYLFADVTPGNYTIEQVNDPNFVDVTDVQGANDSQIALTVSIGETVTAQNFVDEVPASIAGNVSQDENNDDAGERNLAGITVNLIDGAGVTVATQITDADGNYLFADVTPGNYTIEQVNDPNFVDVTDVQGANDSQIALTVSIGETVTAQNFVDEVPASIAGNVSQDENNDDAGERNLAGITVNLIDGAGVTVATQITDADGNYLFADVTPGNYTIEQVNDPNF
ncbi:MAG: SdrD B-like domain-containing protein, partial [Cyanobacteria bacterium J06582_2]